MVACDDRRQQRGRQQAGGRVQQFAEGLQGRRQLQGPVCRHAERRHRRLPRRQRSPHPAGLRSRYGDHDGRPRRGEAGPRDDEGSGREVRSAGLPAGHHRLLLDRQGRDALLPVQLLLDGHVDQQGRAEEGRHRRDPEDLAAGVRSRQEAEGRRPRDLRLLECLGSLGQHRAVLGLAQHSDGHQGQRPRRLRHGDEVQLSGRM